MQFEYAISAGSGTLIDYGGCTLITFEDGKLVHKHIPEPEYRGYKS